MSPIKFPTKRIFPNFQILKINRMMLFCNVFMERPSYFKGSPIAVCWNKFCRLLTLLLRLAVKKAPSSVFESAKKFCSALGVVLWWLLLYWSGQKMQQSDRQSVYGKLLGMTSNTSDYFETGEILWSCWLLWQNRSGISFVVTQVTKSNFPTTSTSKKVFRSHCDNERQPEIAIWPPKPEVLISLELR